MPTAIIPVADFDMVVFGATGDLTLRKLLPALYYRFADAQFSDKCRVIAAARSDLTDDSYRERAEKALREHVKELPEDKLEAFLGLVVYARVDGSKPDGWERLVGLLKGRDRVRVFYLATSPDLYGAVCKNLQAQRLVTEQSRVVLEKPIGHDLKSARQIIRDVGDVFTEKQTYRIDHFLGKETVQNLLALRFANVIFERLWNADVIDHVQITVGETVGVESRGDYYDHSGALRDMIQNHLLQLVCLLAMEPPISLQAEALRDEKLKVLRALRPMAPHEVGHLTVRGQYVAGAVGGRSVDGYLKDLGERRTSDTETFVALKAEVRTWRWASVPFYLRTGKRLPQKVSEVVIQFRAIPISVFPREAAEMQPNRLVIRLQPEEGNTAGHDDQGSRAGRPAASAGGAGYQFRAGVLDSLSGCLRASADGHGAGQRHPVHASGRGGGGVAVGGADTGCVAGKWGKAKAVCGGELGTDGGDRADRAGWADLA